MDQFVHRDFQAWVAKNPDRECATPDQRWTLKDQLAKGKRWRKTLSAQQSRTIWANEACRNGTLRSCCRDGNWSIGQAKSTSIFKKVKI